MSIDFVQLKYIKHVKLLKQNAIIAQIKKSDVTVKFNKCKLFQKA